MCSYFKAVFVGAQSYDFLFTDTGTGESFSYSSSSGITIAPVGQLIPQRSYTVSLTANYALADGSGTSELISIATPNACVISMAAHQVVELRETDRCSNGPKPLNALIAANRWICGAAYYQWRFKQTAPVMDVDYGPVFSSPPVNRFISLTQVAPIPGATYDVQIRPVFSNGSFGTWSTVPRCLQVLGTSSAITQNEQVLLSQDSPEYPQLTVYPNPSRDGMVNLSLIRMDTGQYAIEVVDQMGRIVHQEKLITETSGALNRQLMLDLASGLYTVRVYGVDTDLHVKWVIQP
jgi:hypothetical protein